MKEPAKRKEISVPEKVAHRFVSAIASGADFLETLYGQLKDRDRGRWDGVGYALTRDNEFGTKLVAQTPPGLWGKKAEDYKIGAGDFMVDHIEALIAAAEDLVDITTLYPLPDGQFSAGLQRGLAALANSGRHVRVRILAGRYSPADARQSHYLRELVKPLKSLDGNLEVFVAAQRTGVVRSWNHAKIVAIDGRRAIVGGENLWDGDYLQKAPVHDLNVELSGSAVYHMHLFADEIWKSVSRYWLPNWKPAYWKSGAAEVTSNCVTRSQVKKSPGPGHVSILGAGRFGPLYQKHQNPADYAMLLAIRSAQTVVMIAQQDLASQVVHWYWQSGMRAIAQALIRGCDVYIVLSDDNGKSGKGTSYSNTTVKETADEIKRYVEQERGAPKDKNLIELLCKKLHLATLRFGPSDRWPDPPYEFANHSKFLMIDDKVCYVGSENLYSADLIEYGVFISDPAALKQMREEYWDQLWKHSRRVAISGSDAQTCYFKVSVWPWPLDRRLARGG